MMGTAYDSASSFACSKGKTAVNVALTNASLSTGDTSAANSGFLLNCFRCVIFIVFPLLLRIGHKYPNALFAGVYHYLCPLSTLSKQNTAIFCMSCARLMLPQGCCPALAIIRSGVHFVTPYTPNSCPSTDVGRCAGRCRSAFFHWQRVVRFSRASDAPKTNHTSLRFSRC